MDGEAQVVNGERDESQSGVPEMAQPGSPPTDDVQYEFQSVQALRGREGTTKSKWQNEGWEFVPETRGTLRTELNFRRVKPKTLSDHLTAAVAAYRRLPPKAQLALAASAAAILAAGTIGIVVGAEAGGGGSQPAAASVAPTEEDSAVLPQEEPTEEPQPQEFEAPELTERLAARHLAKAWEDKFPYGGEVHYFADLRAASQNEDGSYFLKIGATVTNQFGTEIDATIEGTVGGTDDNPVILDSTLYAATGEWIDYYG